MLIAKQDHLVIKEGDIVSILAQGIEVTGMVYSARHWGERDGWYIELTDANVPGHYSYYKQGQDGGRVIRINGVDVPWAGWVEVK